MLHKAKDKKNFRWTVGWLTKTDGRCYINNKEVEPTTLCAWTGRKDAVGTMIFEGDYIYNSHTQEIFLVIWDSTLCGFATLSASPRNYIRGTNFKSTQTYCIGSAHDIKEIAALIPPEERTFGTDTAAVRTEYQKEEYKSRFGSLCLSNDYKLGGL